MPLKSVKAHFCATFKISHSKPTVGRYIWGTAKRNVFKRIKMQTRCYVDLFCGCEINNCNCSVFFDDVEPNDSAFSMAQTVSRRTPTVRLMLVRSHAIQCL